MIRKTDRTYYVISIGGYQQEREYVSLDEAHTSWKKHIVKCGVCRKHEARFFEVHEEITIVPRYVYPGETDEKRDSN